MSLPAEEMREETGGGFEGAPEGGHLFGGGRFLERWCLFKEMLYRERLGWMKEWLKNEKR